MQVLLLAVLATVNLAVSTTGDLEWSDHYANAKTQAAAEQRPLLVVLENSADPSGRFDQDHLAAGNTTVDLLKQYRLCRMDVNTAYGKRVADAFGVTTFPFTAITDKTATYVNFRSSGTMNAETWGQTLQQWRDGTVAAPAIQQVEASKIITEWPVYTVPANKAVSGYCPNCVRNQQYYR